MRNDERVIVLLKKCATSSHYHPPLPLSPYNPPLFFSSETNGLIFGLVLAGTPLFLSIAIHRYISQQQEIQEAAEAEKAIAESTIATTTTTTTPKNVEELVARVAALELVIAKIP